MEKKEKQDQDNELVEHRSSLSEAESAETARILRHAMRISLLVSIMMLVGKLGAWWMTSSTALLSDAAESVIHLLATLLAAFSLWYAAQPADQSHVYGHGKIAYFSIGFEGVILGIAGLGILAKAIQDLLFPPLLQRLGAGLLLSGGLILLNLSLGLYLVRVGRRHQSMILEANGQHVLTDMWTSVASLLGVGLVWAFGVRWLDPVAALLIGAHILRSAWHFFHEAYDGLMEHTDEETTKKILVILEDHVHRKAILGYHHLRHRLVYKTLYVEMHLYLVPSLPLREAHERASLLEMAIQQAFGDVEVVITSHLEPQSASPHPKGYHEPVHDPLPLGEAWTPPPVQGTSEK